MRLVCTPRGLSAAETYPCSLKNVKKALGHLEIAVGFGIEKEFHFDTAARHRPQLCGKVIASFSLNRRLPLELQQGQLRFFVVNSTTFAEPQKALFAEKYIPLLLDWYLAKRELQNLGGVDSILIEWDGAAFSVHEMRYA